MRAVYVEKTTNELNYFVCTWNDEDKELEFKNTKSIAAKAFQNASIVKRVFFKENLSKIGKEAFKGCDDLDLFFCEKDTFLQPTENKAKDNEIYCIKSTEKNKNSNSDTTFTIESLAFSKCKNLHTVILPDCKKLVIEKDAFDGCSSLRTVVCFAEEIDFTENPFESCPETLTFVGKREENKEENKDENKTSELERFARENGYRFIDA
ncbi:MAG: leucine-rich repeat protein [Treponema sp.]|nr:leucine-rich repeat protein [Treponema sp.]